MILSLREKNLEREDIFKRNKIPSELIQGNQNLTIAIGARDNTHFGLAEVFSIDRLMIQ